jgi:branched-chain amino acid transport system permease protein
MGKHWQLWMGLFIVLVVTFAPRGLLGALEQLLSLTRRVRSPAAHHPDASHGATEEAP